MIISGRVVSKKNSKRVFRRGGKMVVLPSVAFETFKTSCLWQMKGKTKYKGTVKISFEFHLKGKIDSDIDNMVTSLLDILASAGIIENDKLVMEIYARKIGGYQDFKTIIVIESC